MHRRDLLRAIARTTGDHIRTLKRLGFQLIAEVPADQETNQQGLVSRSKSADNRTLLEGALPESRGCIQ